jgi:hypothetical protein
MIKKIFDLKIFSFNRTFQEFLSIKLIVLLHKFTQEVALKKGNLINKDLYTSIDLFMKL